jgi:hypothetical protein
MVCWQKRPHESREMIPRHADAAKTLEAALLERNRLSKHAMNVQTDNSHPTPS